MSFFILIFVIIFLGSILGWLSFSMAFPDCRKKRYCFLWLLITVVVLFMYYYVHGIARGDFVDVNILLRQQMFKFSVFWLVLQIALVAIFPLWFIYIFLTRKLLSDKKVILSKVLAITLLIVPFGISVKAVYFQDEWRVINMDITSTKVPKELSGLKVAQISDTHVLFAEDIDILRNQLASLANEKPDIIIFTGDLSDARGQIFDTVSAFKQLEATTPLGLWFILGNHEYIQGVDRFFEVYENLNVSLLRNDGVTLYYNGMPFYLAGVDYPFERSSKSMQVSPIVAQSDLQKALLNRPDGMFTILAAHHPITFDDAFANDVFLTLSGHTHAYQVGYNRKSLNVFTQYSWGLYEQDDLFGYVSSGAGEWFPARFGAPQEIVIFTLKHVD